MMSLWGDSTARRSSSFPSRPVVYLRSASSPASSPATARPIANRSAIPKPSINGPLSPPPPTPSLVPFLGPEALLSSSFSSPDTAAHVWHPPSPPVSEIREPAMDQVMSFVHPHGHPSYFFSMMREFYDITTSTHERIVHRLECKLFEYHPKVRIDYFGDLSRLVITIPGEAHEEVAVNAQHYLRQSLFDQGFYWPEWDGNIDRIRLTGSADRTLATGQNPSTFQPDGSLKIAGLDLPFLIIEVADTESYKHARTKSRRFLMGSKGSTRFVVLVDLIRKTVKEMKELALLNDEHEYDNGPETDDGLGSTGEPSPAQPFPEGNKRPAQDYGDTPGTNKRTRTASPESPPQSQTLPPLPPLTPYSRATVTVLTTRIIDNPKIKGRKLRTMERLIDAAECWPTMPAQDVCFSFSWDDMNVEDYPIELRGCKFTIRFEWLNELLQRHFGGFENGVPRMRDDTAGDSVDEDESELDSEDVAMERERLWAVDAKVDSGKVESDDSWKLDS